MFGKTLQIVSVLLLAGLLAAGCGGGTAQQGTAPENPSPEFLRAAEVLKPMAGEPSSGEGNLSTAAMEARLHRVHPAAWEFFGTLSDEQIEKMISTNEVSIPARQLTDKQWDALNHFFDVWREVYKGISPLEWSEDIVVDLYKAGAAEDLSNLVITFKVRSSKRVAMFFYIRRPDGSLTMAFPLGIADL